jgi:hypothetical protein
MSLSRLEVEHLIALVRVHKANMMQKKLELEERSRAHVDGSIHEAILICAAEVLLLQSIAGKLWRSIEGDPKEPL